MHRNDSSRTPRTASPRPLLLLDVDGVLNPFAAPACPPGYREHGFFPDDDPPVRLNDSHAPVAGPALRPLRPGVGHRLG